MRLISLEFTRLALYVLVNRANGTRACYLHIQQHPQRNIKLATRGLRYDDLQLAHD